MVMVKIRKIRFHAAHYLPGHPTCGSVHGHTYEIRNLSIQGEVVEGMIVDFTTIKRYVKETWDHKFIVPKEDVRKWMRVYEKFGLEPNIIGIDYPTAENIALAILEDLSNMLPGCSIKFELYETPTQGVEVKSWEKRNPWECGGDS